MDASARATLTLTLPEFAEAKGFTEAQLRKYGVRESAAGLEIPYHLADGSEAPRVRIRKALSAGAGSKWSSGDAKLVPYGLGRPLLDDQLIVVEGETDCWTLWEAGFTALGIPGASNTGCLRLEHIGGAQTIYVVREPGDAGARFPHRVATVLQSQGFAGSVLAVDLPAKDPHELWRHDPGAFAQYMRDAIGLAKAIELPNVTTEALGFVDGAALAAREPEEPRFIVEPLVPAAALILLTGDTGAGKSAFALSMAVAIARGEPCASTFATTPGRVLYCNAEMGSPVLIRYLREALAGRTLPQGALLFQGQDGFATFRRGEEACKAFEDLVASLGPDLIVFDTMRATLTDDENEVADVRATFGWLRRLTERFGCAILVAHHLRKLSSVSNATRERVSGSRDIIASVDVHLAAKSREGRALHALVLDKTRTPLENAMPGTTWQIEAKLIPGKSSSFAAAEPKADPKSQPDSGTSVDDAADEIRAILDAEEPKTIGELGAQNGSMKRAFAMLRKSGEVILVGKRGRQALFGLPGLEYALESAK